MLENLRRSLSGVPADVVAYFIISVLLGLWAAWKKWLQTVVPRPVSAGIVALVVFSLLVFAGNQVSASWSRKDLDRLANDPQYLEDTLQNWILSWGYSVARLKPEPAHYFALKVSDPTGRVVGVYRPREGSRYLVIYASVHVLGTGTFDERGYSPLVSEIRMELLRLGVEYVGVQEPMSDITIVIRIPPQGLRDFEVFDGLLKVRRAAEITSELLFRAGRARVGSN